jgi:hypothetical protein
MGNPVNLQHINELVWNLLRRADNFPRPEPTIVIAANADRPPYRPYTNTHQDVRKHTG